MNKEYIDFVLVANIEGMHFQPHRPEGFEFKPNSDEEVRFILKPTDPEKDASGHWLGLTCKACKSYPASKDQILFVDAYNYKRKMLGVAESITLPLKRKRSDETLIFEDGTYCDGFHPRKHMCPTDMVELLNQVSSDLFTSVNRFVKLLRWRQLCDAPGELINHSSLYWRVDDGAYLMTPPDDSSSHNVTIQGMFGIHWSNKHADDLRNLWMDNSISEPLGHTLMREAAALSSDSPRSAILMITAALETAIKTHISKIAPDTAWLMGNIQSPPMYKILRDYIPLIHNNRGNKLEYWDKIVPEVKRIQGLIEVRNKVAHTGKIPDDTESIKSYIDLVSGILYLIDVLEGHEWAKAFVDNEMRIKLGWPAAMDKRIQIRISQEY